METISAEEFKKRYGTQGAAQVLQPKETFGQALVSPIKSGIKNIKNIASNVVQTAKNAFQDTKQTVQKTVEGKQGGFSGGYQAVGNLAKTITSPITATISQGVQDVSNNLSENPSFQKFANSNNGAFSGQGISDSANQITQAYGSWKEKHPEAARNLEATVDIANLATMVPAGEAGALKANSGINTIKSGVGDAARGTKNLVADTTSGVVSSAKNLGNKTIGNAVRDVIPTADKFVNEQVAQALDLTAGDLRNIHASTGNDVGGFLAKNNLIGKNLPETSVKLNEFFKQNYTGVRNEIGKVKKVYTQESVPRYTEALIELKKQVGETPGLQKANAEIDILLQKKELKLADVQRVKELIDDHYSLYKATGDVKEGVIKQGLDNIRKDIRSFVEKEVKENTGADISLMNNNVSTAKGIANAVKARAPRGLTRANLSLGDLGIFGVGTAMGGPLGGAALVFAKKLLQSPSIKLRIAKFIDELSDAKKLKIQTELQAGKIPEEFSQFIKPSSLPKEGVNWKSEAGFARFRNLSEGEINIQISEITASLKRMREGGIKETAPAYKGALETLQSLQKEATQVRLKGEGAIPAKLEPLAQEARKYKSAEEFVKGQPTYYHGTSKGNSFDFFDLGKAKDGNRGKNIYLTENKVAAEYFSKEAEQAAKFDRGVFQPNFEKGDILDFKLDPKAKIKVMDSYPASPREANILTEKLKAEGYDGVSFPEDLLNQVEGIDISGAFKNGKPARTTLVFNPNVIKTKSQLTDIWKKATKK